jgi:NAD(P)-dependent dehydrogenase (short-subunit alcohol dehydrogenase family)
MTNFSFNRNYWALILGGSSGFGLATAKKLASHGMNICVVHRDRKGALDRIEQEFSIIKGLGVHFVSLNLDALSSEGRLETLQNLQKALGPDGKVRLLFHSIAFGNLKPIVPQQHNPEQPLIEEEDMARTIYSMGTSLLTWTQELFASNMFTSDARVLAMTSEGNTVAWKGYAAVSAAKVALEAVIRSIAVEFGPHGIRANSIQAGVTDTPALRLIPGSDKMKLTALSRNPMGRLTLPEDVAGFISLLCTDEASWVNGALLRVDGGEQIAPTCSF